MRGFKTGCNLVAPQELWLGPDNLPNLSMISDSIVGLYYCASGMTEKTCSGLVSVRQFAGVAFVWNKEYSKCNKVLGSNAIGAYWPVCAITVTLRTRSVIIINYCLKT